MWLHLLLWVYHSNMAQWSRSILTLSRTRIWPWCLLQTVLPNWMTDWSHQALSVPLGIKQKPGWVGKAVSQCLAPVAMAPVAMVPKQFHLWFPSTTCLWHPSVTGPRNPFVQTRKKADNRKDEQAREVIKQTWRKWRWKEFGVKPRNSLGFYF